MIEMGRGQHNAGVSDLSDFDEIGPARQPPAAIAPGVSGGIEPATVRQTSDLHPMRAAAPLADAGGALEPHPLADLRPIARIKPSHFRPDRHRHPHLP
jgi:hypothetical protein